MSDDIPCVIQTGDGAESANLPLVLFHDGGGTCFSYFNIGQLGRAVYGINNPRLQSLRAWSGGLPEMISVYTELLMDIDAPHGIILGGWSFGGLLALGVAAELESRCGTLVAGVIMIDTSYPLHRENLSSLAAMGIPIKKDCSPEIRFAVQRSFINARHMAASWSPPSSMRHPATILIRAEDEHLDQSVSGYSSFDKYRNEADLGWSHYDKRLLSLTFDVPGTHFSIFEPSHIGTTTVAVRDACGAIQKTWRSAEIPSPKVPELSTRVLVSPNISS